MLFFFYNQISFSFSSISLVRLKMTEYNPICKLLTEVFLITRIPHSTVLIHFGQREKAIL